MGEVATDHWHPSAAYLYVLHLDGPALAWEYLRRHPNYRRDWLRRRRDPEAARRWGLRLLEDPALDAGDAHPAWFPDHDGVVQLYPDADPPPGAQRFAFWHLPGRKHLIHDGRRLLLITRWPGCCVRLAITAGLEDGMAYAYAVRAGSDPCSRDHLLAHELDKLAANQTASGAAQPRPSSTALLEPYTLQALDGILAGASRRTVAQVVFGAAAVASDWHADGALRARVRRLVRRGQILMRGDYRHLAQLPLQAQEQGRSGPLAERP